jgi:DNA-binding SARP family transcriptional activator
VAANGRELPSWAVTEAFVSACGDDPGQWRAVWEQARQAAARIAAAGYVTSGENNPASTSLQFRILGPVRASRAGVDLGGLGPKGRSLLAMLLLNANRRVSLDRLAEAVTDNELQRYRTLQTDISRLRKVLNQGAAGAAAPGLLTSVTGGYRLTVGEEQLDLARFRRLLQEAREARRAGALDQAAHFYQQALAEWSGEPLADVSSTEFEGLRSSLTESHRAAELESLEVQADLGRHHDVAAACRRLLAELQFDQHVAQLLMRALHSAGRTADALAVYREMHQRLNVELGLEPDKRIQQLHQAILTNDLDRSWSSFSST